MKKPNEITRKTGGAARQGARRGSVYDQIAEARVRRKEVLSERDENGTDPAAADAIAALRGKDAPPPVVRKKRNALQPAVTPPPPVDVAIATKADEPPPERSLEELVMAAEVADAAPRPSKGPLWIASLTIAALAVGSVAWFSRPATNPVVDVSPAISVNNTPPNVFADGAISLTSPDAGEALELALASTAWSGLSVVTPDAPAEPGLDSVASAPEAVLQPVTTPRPRPASLGVSDAEAEVLPSETDEVAEAAISEPVPEPDVAESDTESVAESATETAPAETPTADQATRDIRVVLNAPQTVPDASLAAVIRALQDSGADADPRRVNLTISTSNVRYFHPEDAAAAAVIADGIGARLRDFTDFEPTPPEGLVEIWMAGREVGTRPSGNDGPLDQLAQDLRQLQQDLRRALGGN